MVPLPVFCTTRISRTCLDSAGFYGDSGSARFAAVWISVDGFLQNPAHICCSALSDTGIQQPGLTFDAGPGPLSTTLSNYQTTRKQL